MQGLVCIRFNHSLCEILTSTCIKLWNTYLDGNLDLIWAAWYQETSYGQVPFPLPLPIRQEGLPAHLPWMTETRWTTE